MKVAEAKLYTVPPWHSYFPTACKVGTVQRYWVHRTGKRAMRAAQHDVAVCFRIIEKAAVVWLQLNIKSTNAEWLTVGPLLWGISLRPIYTVQLCRMRHTYDKSTT